MTASGESSIRNYECGSPPLIDLYQTLVATDGVHGARFSGAGFRGCCVALVEPEAADRSPIASPRPTPRRHPDLAEHASIVALRDRRRRGDRRSSTRAGRRPAARDVTAGEGPVRPAP